MIKHYHDDYVIKFIAYPRPPYKPMARLELLSKSALHPSSPLAHIRSPLLSLVPFWFYNQSKCSWHLGVGPDPVTLASSFFNFKYCPFTDVVVRDFITCLGKTTGLSLFIQGVKQRERRYSIAVITSGASDPFSQWMVWFCFTFISWICFPIF